MAFKANRIGRIALQQALEQIHDAHCNMRDDQASIAKRCIEEKKFDGLSIAAQAAAAFDNMVQSNEKFRDYLTEQFKTNAHLSSHTETQILLNGIDPSQVSMALEHFAEAQWDRVIEQLPINSLTGQPKFEEKPSAYLDGLVNLREELELLTQAHYLLGQLTAARHR